MTVARSLAGAHDFSYVWSGTVRGVFLLAITGGCLCRAVRYEVKAEAPLGARYCWCRVCQYLGCGAGAVGTLFRKDDVTVSGPLRDYVCQADSGATMHRRFCTQCGTQVFSEAEERPTSGGAYGDHLDPIGAEM